MCSALVTGTWEGKVRVARLLEDTSIWEDGEREWSGQCYRLEVSDTVVATEDVMDATEDCYCTVRGSHCTFQGWDPDCNALLEEDLKRMVVL